MKLARNLVIGLTLLVLLYGGSYWFLFRDRVYAIGFPSDSEMRWHKFFAPATELDFRMTHDRPRRKYLRGHWTNPETGDFVTIAGNGTFTFQLGKTRASGQATISRLSGGYYAEFKDGGLTRAFAFLGYDPAGSFQPIDIAVAKTSIVSKTRSESEAYKTKLTRSPAP